MHPTRPHARHASQGICFVKFEQLSAAAKARESLDKRQFDGNTVRATFVSEADMASASAS